MRASAAAAPNAGASEGMPCAQGTECFGELQVSMSGSQHILAVPTLVPSMFLSGLPCGAKQEAELKQALAEYLQGLDSVNDALSQGPEAAEAQQVCWLPPQLAAHSVSCTVWAPASASRAALTATPRATSLFVKRWAAATVTHAVCTAAAGGAGGAPGGRGAHARGARLALRRTRSHCRRCT